jgi:F0F1-type ATP synthase membrane subunit b/b'
MSLPQLDLTFLSSQVFWLFLTSLITYWFNKKIFLPQVLGNLQKRNTILKNLREEKERLELHIKTVELEITENLIRSQNEARRILANATKKGQELLQEAVKQINKDFQNKAENYTLESQKIKVKLESDLHVIVDDIKIKVKNFIMYNV